MCIAFWMLSLAVHHSCVVTKVWMITIIGTTLGIPDTVMGLTFVAAGVSIPDALSSIAVIKEGYGDMAVSNAVGSNVFDILVCLGLPWLIQTTILVPGGHVNVISKGMRHSVWTFFHRHLSLNHFIVQDSHIQRCHCYPPWYSCFCRFTWTDGNWIVVLVSFWWYGISYSSLWHPCMNWTSSVYSIHLNVQVSERIRWLDS